MLRKLTRVATEVGLAALLLFAACGGNNNGDTIPEGTNFVIQTEEALQGMPVTYAPNIPIFAYHMFDQPGAYGSVTQVNTNSNSKGRIYVVNGRVNARWHFVWSSYPCQGLFRELNVPAPPPLEQVTLTCIVTSGSFFSEGSLGYLTAYVPNEYWSQQPDLPQPPGPGGSDTLIGDQRLNPDQSIYSANGRFRLIYQLDGNLVLYDGGSPIWASNTFGDPGFAIMQLDGNFVVYDAGGTPVWDSGTVGNDGAYLAVQDDGDMVIYRTDGAAAWWSGTGS